MNRWFTALLFYRMSIVLITGGSGLIGKRLTLKLQQAGHTVRWLGRSGSDPATGRFNWDIHQGTVDARALVGVDHIVHLSGAGIADKRWTDTRMKELYASRGGAARLLLGAVRAEGAKPLSFISASGVGYYGAITSDHVFTEEDPPAQDTIGALTQDWELAADTWSDQCRVVKLRTPVVLAREGGALPKLSAPAKWGLSAPLGRGSQWMPWVHVDDLVNAYATAIERSDMSGAYNVVAPEQPDNRAFMRAVAHALHKPFFLPAVPAFALRISLGELSSVLLEGSRASQERLLRTGFVFRYPELGIALRDTLG